MIKYEDLLNDLKEIEEWCKENNGQFRVNLHFVEDGKFLLADFIASNKPRFPLDGDLRPRKY